MYSSWQFIPLFQFNDKYKSSLSQFTKDAIATVIYLIKVSRMRERIVNQGNLTKMQFSINGIFVWRLLQNKICTFRRILSVSNFHIIYLTQCRFENVTQLRNMDEDLNLLPGTAKEEEEGRRIYTFSTFKIQLLYKVCI